LSKNLFIIATYIDQFNFEKMDIGGGADPQKRYGFAAPKEDLCRSGKSLFRFIHDVYKQKTKIFGKTILMTDRRQSIYITVWLLLYCRL